MEINDQTFQMLLDRFDRVDKDNEEIMKSLAAHVQDDLEVHEVVSKHSVYWSLFLYIGGAAFLGGIGTWLKTWFR